MTEKEYILLQEMKDNCIDAVNKSSTMTYIDSKAQEKYDLLCKLEHIAEVQGKWDINKDTRNSRQRVANAQCLKELSKTREDLGYLKAWTTRLLNDLNKLSDADELDYNDILYIKSHEVDSLVYNFMNNKENSKALDILEYNEDNRI